MSELKQSIATGADLTAATFADFVQRLRHHVRGDGVNWHNTANALFTVQERRIIFGIDRDYASKLAVYIDESMYFSPQEYWDEADEDMRANLDKIAIDDGDALFLSLDQSDQWDILGELPDHTVSGWDDRWDYVNSHLTKEAAEAFIKRKKHDYPKGLRVYVEAQVYCWEFNEIINGLLEGQIVFAQPEANADAKDAERYRWLRDKSGADTATNGFWSDCQYIIEIDDEAIDAARQSTPTTDAPQAKGSEVDRG